jgi:hypothetical protein
VRLLAWSWKVEIRYPESGAYEPFDADEGGRIFALWHGRLLVGLCSHADRSVTVLVSPSEDGSLVTRLLGRFRYAVIRGSSSRGGARAVRSMLAVLQRDGIVVITPDGPRGPRHSMNPGLAWMARATGAKVVPVGLVCDRAWRLKSWDAFTIPKLGARVVVQYGRLLVMDRRASETEQEAFTDRVRGELLEAEESAFRHLDIASDLGPDQPT